MVRALPAALLAAALVACGPAPVEVRVIIELSPTAAHEKLRAWLELNGAHDFVSLPIINGLSAVVAEELVPRVRTYPGVVRVTEDEQVQVTPPPKGGRVSSAWNLEAIRAPALWGLGLRGAGAVVANLDTGVDLEHPALRGKWREGGWFDPVSGSTAPFDPIGHGTQTMGLMVGDEVGVAPAAKWIAARVYDGAGRSSVTLMHQAFAWVLDPDGDPSTHDSPDVVNVSWAFEGADVCNRAFERDLEVLRAANVLVVFAAGNSGPLAPSSTSPANNAGAFSVGAVALGADPATFTSRGPSRCTGGVFPSVVAPGEDVRTTDLSYGGEPRVAIVSGTSFAAPQVAGAAALLRGALPSLAVERLERALEVTSTDLGELGADDVLGHGLVDVERAYELAQEEP